MNLVYAQLSSVGVPTRYVLRSVSRAQAILRDIDDAIEIELPGDHHEFLTLNGAYGERNNVFQRVTINEKTTHDMLVHGPYADLIAKMITKSMPYSRAWMQHPTEFHDVPEDLGERVFLYREIIDDPARALYW